MNSFELNKIFGAILGTLVFVMGVGFIADEIYRPIEGRGASYTLAEEETGEGAAEDTPGVEPIAVRMQTASIEAGQSLMVRCQACHDYSPANANRAGPGIYDVVGNPMANNEGFPYSSALAALGQQGEIWDYEHLDAFFESPRNAVPGTTMSFAGLSNPDDRANLIAFLRSLTDGEPYPLPEADAAPAEDIPPESEEPPAEAETAPSDQPVLDEVEQLTLDDAAEGDDAPVVDAPAPQADPTPQTEEQIPGAGQPAADPSGEATVDNAPPTGTNGATGN